MCRAAGSLSLCACRAACLPTRARCGREHDKAIAEEDAITLLDHDALVSPRHFVCISAV
jgi:hypothetical protein